MGDAAFVDLERSIDDGKEPKWEPVLKGTTATSHVEPDHGSRPVSYRLVNPLRWKVTTVDRDLMTGGYSTLRFDPKGQPVISYENANKRHLKVAREEDGKWKTEIVDTTADPYASSMGISPEGRICIAYFDHKNLDLKYAEKGEEQDWQISTLAQEGYTGDRPSLVFNAKGQPAISYWRATKSAIMYTERSEAGWTTAEVGVGEVYSSLAFDPQGRPCVAYKGIYELMFASFDGKEWSSTLASSEPNPPKQEGAFDVSMAFDSTGSPVMSHWTKVHKRLQLEIRKNGTWSSTVVDDKGDVGISSALAFTPSGQIAISYCDSVKPSEPKLKYAVQTPTGWSICFVDADVGGGYQTSLAFDRDGLPAISYYDLGRRNLKIARLQPLK